ncbi:hypothetical protein FGADI_6264 [Fusarium gaditjirri]|uniref:NACHT-NTPase and P-loop NTPases N-terminal domain-containing protein n=1 Tax=Fusarium gaditjirri TaxID=282569 RepID=A0A8H4T896_9HYPO|nr:hypothetical protein FGADI_6264 [Fusarium gaditjirri]
MAEILGLASSIITIVEVAGKLGTNTIRLKRLWDEVQDVPASIRRCIEQLEILAPAMEEMDYEFEKTRNMVRNDSAAKRSLEYSRKAVETLDTLVRDMETQISTAKTSRRLVAQLKVRIKLDVIEDHQQRLTSALQLLSLSQQTYLIALSRAQPEIIISEIRNWRNSEAQRQALIGPEADNQSTQGEEIQGTGSPGHFKTPASREFSLWQMESIKTLILLGMRIFDIKPDFLFLRLAFWSWSEPETSRSIEVARIWQADTGGAQQEHLSDPGFGFAFCTIPNLHTIVLEAGSVRQMLSTWSWSFSNPAVALELIKSGIARTSDFPPNFCVPRTDGTCQGETDTFIYQYFHALLNNEGSFNDWRCLARKMFLEVSPLDIVHPHDGFFWNLTGIIEALWKRQFLLLPFARWIQNAVTLWLEDLAAAGINLEEYMSLELLYSRKFRNNAVYKDTKAVMRPGARLPESGPSLVILSVGPRADDWSFSWDPCVEELSGEFWTTLEDAHIKVPGAWVEERTEDFGCIMGYHSWCLFRRAARSWSKMPSKRMRSRGLHGTKRKGRKRLRIRGMVTCEEL